MDADGEPARFGNELFRARHFVVRSGWDRGDRGLEVESVMAPAGSITIRLDEFQARDLLNALAIWDRESQRVGWPRPVGPAER